MGTHAQGPESVAKTSLPSWAPMLLVMSKASGTAEAESSLLALLRDRTSDRIT